ncbi:hypothetical protein ACIF8T_39135 [Streptomyces sp. NPDC085946]|uniref:hypothetical protein n=1 Tax=Streptomyces sp. NPDC085946 TaxID=3365744 RepID=UPI0037D7EBA4
MVSVGADRYRPQSPPWPVITHEQLQDLAGATVATDCGTGYLPRAVEVVLHRVDER